IALLTPVAVDPRVRLLDWPALVLVTSLAALFLARARVGRVEGAVLLGAYAVYAALHVTLGRLAWTAPAHRGRPALSRNVSPDDLPAADGGHDQAAEDADEKRSLAQLRRRLAGQHDVRQRPREDTRQVGAVGRARDVPQRAQQHDGDDRAPNPQSH